MENVTIAVVIVTEAVVNITGAMVNLTGEVEIKLMRWKMQLQPR